LTENAKSCEICYISPYPALTSLIQECFIDTPNPPLVVEAATAAAETVLCNFLEQGVEVFVTTEYNARYLRTRHGVPIVAIPFTAFDIVCALKDASTQHGHPIALFQFLYSNPLLPTFKEIIGCDIHEFVFHNVNDARNKLIQAKKEGFKVVVCGGLVHAMAQQVGCERVLLMPKKEAIPYSYDQAQQIVLARYTERHKATVFRCVVEYSFDGIIAIDKQNRITVFNPAAEHILGIPAQKAIGNALYDVLPENLLPTVIENGVAQLDQVKTFSQKKIVINAVPIYDHKDLTETIFTLQEVKRIEFLEEKVRRTTHNNDFVAAMTFDDIITISNTLRGIINHAKRFANSKETVLITGETGTGKEVFAQSIHNESPFRDHPFVGINCAAIQPTLLESELFGYAEGSFTGAKQGGKKGLFELAHGGTIFLDEIGELPQDAQVRLLRVLQEKQVRRVGDIKVIPIDVRVIAATNQQLEDAVNNGRFRSDLYYRLNVLQLRIPPLREHPEDILPLSDAFLYQCCAHTETRMIIKLILNKYQQILTDYSWPGNIRELQNLIKRISVLCETKADGSIEGIVRDMLSAILKIYPEKDTEMQLPSSVGLKGVLENTESALIARLYEQVHYNKSELARQLGVGRTTLWRKLNKLALEK
jgi:transcriptional regulator with PAS, ATPase and Fis domain